MSLGQRITLTRQEKSDGSPQMALAQQDGDEFWTALQILHERLNQPRGVLR